MSSTKDDSGEKKLRGNALQGAEQPDAVDHTSYERKRKPDAVLRTDGEADTLYDDGLDMEDDSRPQIDTDGRDDNALK